MKKATITFISLISLIMLTITGLTACNGETGATLLEDTTWVLESYGDKGNPTAVLEDTEITALFNDEGQVTGSAGCNSYSAGYEVSGNKLSISQPATTRMFCEGVMEQENQYLSILKGAETFNIDGEKLVIESAGNKVLNFKTSTGETGATLLEDTTWVLESYGDKGNPTAVLEDTEITALFNDEGQVTGSAGCNGYSAGYEVSGNKLSVSEYAASTMMFCEGVMEQENQYLSILKGAETFSIDGEKLVIESAGNKVLNFKTSTGETAANPLENTNWMLESYGDKGNPTAVLKDTEITALFNDEGQVTGSAGCNGYSAGYEVSGNKLSISEYGPSTMMFCEGIMEQEDQYLSILKGAETFSIDGEKLVIESAGNKVLNFKTSTGETAATPLENTNWVLESYGDKGNPTAVLKDTEITALFNSSDSQVTGSAGCNRYFAGYEVSGNKLSISEYAASTMMFCEGIMEQEDQYLLILKGAETFSIDGDKLVIESAGNKVLNFKASTGETAATPLEDTTWVLESYGDKGNPTAVLEDTEITALFNSKDGQVTGSAGCNGYFAGYEVSGNKLSISEYAVTMKFCEGIMEQENQYLSILKGAETFNIDGEKLVIESADNQVLNFSVK